MRLAAPRRQIVVCWRVAPADATDRPALVFHHRGSSGPPSAVGLKVVRNAAAGCVRSARLVVRVVPAEATAGTESGSASGRSPFHKPDAAAASGQLEVVVWVPAVARYGSVARSSFAGCTNRPVSVG